MRDLVGCLFSRVRCYVLEYYDSVFQRIVDVPGVM